MIKHVVVLGGGLAGLSCAYELAAAGVEVTVIEREQHAGGMASSFIEDGPEYWSYDFGPHRFHTTEPELIEHVQQILAGNHRQASRLSRILLFGRFFDYPLRAGNVLRNLPRRVLVRSFLDYFWVRFTEMTRLSHHSDENFEGWVTKRFGRTLYDLFFGRYTGKAWKMAPEQISGDWASQRISLLSLGDAVKKTLFRPRNAPRTLVSEFLYPDRGGIGEIARGYVRELRSDGLDGDHRGAGDARAPRRPAGHRGRVRRRRARVDRGRPLHLDDSDHRARPRRPPRRSRARR